MAGRAYSTQTLQKLKVEPPGKFTGKEDFDRWLKKVTNYLSLTDQNYAELISKNVEKPKRVLTAATYPDIDTNLLLEDGTGEQMSKQLYYVLDGLLDETTSPWTIFDTEMNMNGFEVLRKLIDRYMKGKQMKAILLLVKIVSTKFDESNFELTFSAWENDIVKFEMAIGKPLYEEIKMGLLISGTTGNSMIICA